MIRLAAVAFLSVAACAHDHALDRGEVGAMKNSSPAISPWPSGPQTVLVEGPDGKIEPPAQMAVLTSKGAFPARLACGALYADVAALELPEAARDLDDPAVAQGIAQ